MVNELLDDVFEQYFDSIRHLTLLFSKEVHALLVDFTHLNHTEIMVLKTLKRGGAVSQHDIALDLCHTDASVSKLVSALADQNLVSVDVDDNNRRRVVVQITAEGVKALSGIEKYLIKSVRGFYEGISEKQLKDLTSFNEKIASNISKKQKDN